MIRCVLYGKKIFETGFISQFTVQAQEAMPGKFIFETGYRLQCRNHIFNMAGLQKTHAPDKAVRDSGCPQSVFNDPCMSCTAEHQHNLTWAYTVTQFGTDAFQGEICLIEIRMKSVKFRFVSGISFVGAQILFVFNGGVLQKHIGNIQNFLTGTVIFGKFQRDAVGELIAEVMDILEIRSPKRVNTLGIISYAEKID